MYSIIINSDHQFASKSDSFGVMMEASWPNQPTWNQVTELFMNFLKASGYVFDHDEFLDVRKEIVTAPEVDSLEPETNG